jgi:8-amino-7-oxononanoate synthase
MGEIEIFLRQRAEEGLLRTLRPMACRKEGRISSNGREYLDLSSNDYLALADHPRMAASARQALDAFGTSASASRLMSGDLDICHRLEDKTALFKGKGSALVFNTGYQANVGIISALCSRNDCIFSDRLNHASILDGAKLSGAELIRFRHNDAGHLKALLESRRHKFRKALIVTETIFSMDGDRPPLREIAALKERYGCELMVDEAHATGIFGSGGSGIVEEEGLSEQVDIVMGTFGKALGSFGAYLASTKSMVDYMVNSCRAFIYSTALPPPVIAANTAAIELIQQEPWRRKRLLELASYFRNALTSRGFTVKGESQIVPLVVGDTGRAVKLAERLWEKGFWVLPIRPPTVPQGQARLRFSITLHHDEEMLRRLVDEIVGLGL